MKLGRAWGGYELATLLNGEACAGAAEIVIQALSWDSRQLTGEAAAFIALRAQRDGHAYVEMARRRGAVLAIVEKPPPIPVPYILVRDTWEALYRWAAAWRRMLPYPILALTGSVGKTWIKEWLAYLMEGEKRTIRSPGSYNSRLGVPVSLLSFPMEAELGIVEAGISAPGDMEPLAELIRPQYGMLTPMGSAHEEAFPDFATKLREKLRLFRGTEWFLALWQPQTAEQLYVEKSRRYLVSDTSEGDFRMERVAPYRGVWHLPDGASASVQLPEDSLAAWQNAMLAASAAYLLGVPVDRLSAKLATLPTLTHRLQWIQDGSGRLWLDDTYHSDATSLHVAIEELRGMPIEPKVAILTDFSPYTRESHEAAIHSLRSFLPEAAIHLIGEMFGEVGWKQWYPTVEDFFRRAVLPQRGAFLLKGSRRYKLEKVLERLMGYGPAPALFIDLEKVYRNLIRLRERLPSHTRLMGVLKAEAYGGGDILMASFLQRQGIAYIGVAYTREAIRLREAGIDLPIVVFYPGEAPHRLYLEYHLEAAAGSMEALRYWTGEVPLHIEFDTGMGRMGIPYQALEETIAFLRTHQPVVKGVFTHLAKAGDPAHPLTQQQLARFEKIYQMIKALYPEALGHILNTAGILAMGDWAAYDMVRVGIGLYGIGAGLEEATQLTAPILRIAPMDTGQRVNYDFHAEVPAGTEVATVALGYGDGLPRQWAEQSAHVFLHGQPCRILPPLNMDLMLVAVPSGLAQVGDTVEIWGTHRSLSLLADEAGTIPYELLVRLSRRVYRRYSWGG